MACLDNVIIQQTVTYSSADAEQGLISGQIEYEILNIGATDVEGTITVDKVRDLLDAIDADPITQTDSIVSSGGTVSYNFYYPQVEPESVTINALIEVRIGDCLYSASCNHVLLATNETGEQSSCSVEVFGVEVVSGCTNPLFYEYNPAANVDDGSCQNLLPVLGCTNPLATNYNPDATFNDGSCVFKSGCTNPIANNYDADAVIDDGSCQCGDINVELDFFENSGQTFALSGDCEYFLEFDLITKIQCGKFIDYFVDSNDTFLNLLNQLKINVEFKTLVDNNGVFMNYSGGTIDLSGQTSYITTQSENIFEFNVDNKPIGIGLTGSTVDCDKFFDLLSLDLGLECNTFDQTAFDVTWKNFKIGLNSDLIGTFTKYVLNLENFRFGTCIYLDNVKLTKVCTTQNQRCVLIPSTYGFELERVIDNKKAWVYSEDKITRSFDSIPARDTEYIDYDSRLIFNTKEVELRVNPVKYIEYDVEQYYNYFAKFYSDIDLRLTTIDKDKLSKEYINVKNRQTIRRYAFLPTIYERYLDELDCAPSKALGYSYGFDILEKVGGFWYKLIKNLVPATSIWDENEYVLKNNIFHNPKHVYKKYSLTNGSNGEENCTDITGATIECNTLSKACFDEPFDSIDNLLVSGSSDIFCENTGTSICFTNFIGDGSFTGKLIQYFDTSGDSIQVLDLIGYDNYDCFTGDTTGVTDVCEGIIIDPNVTYECIQVSGSNTGFATLSINPTGGTPPYVITGGSSGDTVSDGDILNIIVTDANGCQSEAIDGIVIIDCPVTGDTCVNPVDCSSNTNTFSLEVSIENITTILGNPPAGYSVNVDLQSTSGYGGTIKGSYKVSGLSIPEILVGRPRYHDTADATPYVALSDYIEFGFNQFTPVSPSSTDSPWSFIVFEDANIPDWVVGSDITFTVACYDDDYCVHKGTGTITLPADGVTNTITINF